MPIEVPPGFAQAVRAREGDAGRRWLARLPGLVGRLLGRWRCERDGPVAHGSVGVVVPVRRRGLRAVVKVSFPHPANTGEWTALAAFAGRGAVRLYEADPAAFAMLLERVGPRDLSSLPDADEAMAVAGDLTRQLSVPAPRDLPHLSELVAGRDDGLVAEHREQPARVRLPDAAVEGAARTFRELAHDTTATMLHGDLHVTNVLASDRQPWLAVDPKGLAGTSCYDAATVVRHGLLGLAADPRLPDTLVRRAVAFSEAAAVDSDLALRCVQARFVESYYWEVRHHSPDAVAGAMRAAALAASAASR